MSSTWSIVDVLECKLPRLHNDFILSNGKEGEWMLYLHVHYVFKFLCKADYATNMFIHAPTFSYNKVKSLGKVAIVVPTILLMKWFDKLSCREYFGYWPS